MRAYTVAAAAVALNTEPKWLDNLLSHHEVPGVDRGRQGMRRALAPSSILVVAVAKILVNDLGIPIARAVALAARLCADDDGVHAPSPDVSLRVDRDAIARRLERRLAEAAELVVPPRRGRPRSAARSRHFD